MVDQIRVRFKNFLTLQCRMSALPGKIVVDQVTVAAFFGYPERSENRRRYSFYGHERFYGEIGETVRFTAMM